MTDLAALLIAVIEANREAINASVEKHPGEPIRIAFDWHPQFRKVETVIQPSDRLPTYKAA